MPPLTTTSFIIIMITVVLKSQSVAADGDDDNDGDDALASSLTSSLPYLLTNMRKLDLGALGPPRPAKRQRIDLEARRNIICLPLPPPFFLPQAAIPSWLNRLCCSRDALGRHTVGSTFTCSISFKCPLQSRS